MQKSDSRRQRYLLRNVRTVTKNLIAYVYKRSSLLTGDASKRVGERRMMFPRRRMRFSLFLPHQHPSPPEMAGDARHKPTRSSLFLLPLTRAEPPAALRHAHLRRGRAAARGEAGWAKTR